MLRFLVTLMGWVFPSLLVSFGMWFGLLTLDPQRDTLGLHRVLPVQCNSMIFGTSRSAQGVNPEILEREVPESGKWLNFSFNLAVSPWNDSYAEALRQKLACSIVPGQQTHFIFFADPWSLDEEVGRGEASWFTADWSDVCDMNVAAYAWNKTNPLDVYSYGSGNNLLTTITSLNYQILRTFSNDGSNAQHGVQKNGWLPNLAIKSKEEKQRAILEKVDAYRSEKTIGTTWPGDMNIRALERSIQVAQEIAPEAKIFLIRPPTSDEMRTLETLWFPSVNQALQMAAMPHGITFIDAHAEWKERDLTYFNDGHHMSVDGANAFSTFLAKVIAFD